jgi:hypothetical protein
VTHVDTREQARLMAADPALFEKPRNVPLLDAHPALTHKTLLGLRQTIRASS